MARLGESPDRGSAGSRKDDEGNPTMAASYFLLRVQHLGDDPGGLSGAVERLSTGEKRSFQTAQELIELLGAWPTPHSKMPSGESGGKRPTPAPGMAAGHHPNRPVKGEPHA